MTEIYNEFEKWLNSLLENIVTDNIKAFNFNLYDEEDETYGVQLIGADEFSESDADWACSEVYSSEEDIFYIDHSDETASDPLIGLEFICGLVSRYLELGVYREKLKAVTAVGAGFIDGDIILVNS